MPNMYPSPRESSVQAETLDILDGNICMRIPTIEVEAAALATPSRNLYYEEGWAMLEN